MKSSSNAIVIAFFVTIVMLLYAVGSFDEIDSVRTSMILFSSFIIVASWIIVLIILKNDIIHMKNIVFYSQSRIEMVIEKRYDLLVKMLSVVNRHTDAEAKHLRSIMETRGKGTFEQKVRSSDDAVLDVYSVAEAYPTLEFNKSWKTLIGIIIELEKEVFEYKKQYNLTVATYNSAIEKFPVSAFKFMFKFKHFDLLRQDVTNFNANDLFK